MRTFRGVRSLVAVPALLVATSGLALVATESPAAALDPGYVEEISQSYNGSSGSGTLPECGSRNMNGRGNGNAATWSMQSSIEPFTDVEIGDEWFVRGSVVGLTANGGNDGPDPLNVVFPVYGPVAAASAPDPTTYGPGEVLHGGSGFVGPVAAIGSWGYEFDMNSDPKGLSAGDGVQAMVTIHLRATAPGEVGVRRMDVYGHDGTPTASNFACELISGWYWNVLEPPKPPTSGTDKGTTDARYSIVSFGDENGGEHGIDIDVLANDDDPNTSGGVGNTSQVKIKAWGDAAHGTVDCGNEALNGTESFINMSTGPCTYWPDPDYSGNDTFNYRLRSISGLEKVVPVSITVKPNRAPTMPGVLNYAMTTGQQIVDAPLATDPDGDQLSCFSQVALPDGVTVELDGDTCTFDYVPPDDSPVQFTIRACDNHPLLTDLGFPANVSAHTGYDLGGALPDDLTDETGRRCAERDVNITVQDVDQFLVAEPVGVGDATVVDAGYAGENGPYQVRVPVVDNDIDYGNNAFPTTIGGLFLTGVPAGTAFDPAWGTASVAANGRDILFSPAPGLEGPIEFSYRVCDTGDPDAEPGDPVTALCGFGTVSIYVVPNAAPIPTDDAAVTASTDPVVDLDVGANDSEPDGEPLSCVAGDLAAVPVGLVATASISDTCLLDVTPMAGAAGVAELTYTVCDSHQLSQPGTADDPYDLGPEPKDAPDSFVSRCVDAVAQVTIVDVEVEGEQDEDPVPTCVDDVGATTAGTSLALAVLDNDSDVDGVGAASPLEVSGVGVQGQEDVTAQGGTLSDDGVTVTYTPAPGFAGVDTFLYSAVDTAGQGCSAQATVEVTAVPGAAGDQSGRGTLPQTGAGRSTGTDLLPLGLSLALAGFGFRLAGRNRARRPV